MYKLGCLLLVWTICGAVVASDEQNGFVQPLDFGPIFDSGEPGISSLASNPVAAAVLKVENNQYPQLFNNIVSSSVDSLQLAPRENEFSAEHFGFNPIASQSFLPPAKPANLVAQLKQQQVHPHSHAIPLRYNIRTVHDPNYKVYKPEENQEGEEILSALKRNPTVAAYFKPTETNVEVSHPLNYRREELSEISENDQKYKPNAYITGPARIRRYTSGRKSETLKRKSSEEEEDPYDYKVEYISKPKAFDSELYSSAYKEDNTKNPKNDYEYPYGGYDSGYDHKEYDRIKALSEQQAAEVKQNPGNCKQVQRDGMTCTTCKDPKTGGNFESCSYVAEPKNNKYAYSKERKFDSNDEPDETDTPQQPEQTYKSEKYETAPKGSEKQLEKLTADEPRNHDSKNKYKSYYTHSSNPSPSESLRATDDKQSSEEHSSLVKPYNYQKALPGFYSDNEPKKDVEHVLAEFKRKDRSTCKKVQKNGMTCFQCIDKTGLKNEECMFVSESAPKRSHLAYQEVKEFTSKPATLHQGGAEGAESQTVTTIAPTTQKSAAYVVDNNTYGKKLKRKKAPQSTAAAAASTPLATPVNPSVPSTTHKTKRSVDSVAEQKAQIVDESNLAPPEEFAGADSKGAFWAETMPRYSATLGVTLPEFMLSRSEHEISFDETVAGA